MGVLFAGVLAVFSHVFERIVLLGKTLWQRRTIALTLLLLLIALFTFMSITRAEYLSKQVIDNSADAINIHFSPLPFIATSLLLFIVAVAINHFFFPSTAERAAMRDYRHIKKEKQANETEQEQIEQAIDATQQESTDLKKTNASILEYGCMLEQLIISNAYRGFSLWKKHNIMHRPDDGRPLSFDDPYPLNFDTNFHPLKSMINENIK
jgi:cell division protein FtsB